MYNGKGGIYIFINISYCIINEFKQLSNIFVKLNIARIADLIKKGGRVSFYLWYNVLGDTVPIILVLIAVKKEIIGWHLEFKMLKLTIESLKKEIVGLDNRLIRLFNFLCYR